jgi:hypothetical protein
MMAYNLAVTCSQFENISNLNFVLFGPRTRQTHTLIYVGLRTQSDPWGPIIMNLTKTKSKYHS